MRVVAYIFLVGFLVGCEDEIRDTTRCVECSEDVKIGANRCKHCGADPYGGGLEGMRDRNDDLSDLIQIKRERGGVGSWPWQRKWRWWKWPVMFYLTCVFLGCVYEGIERLSPEPEADEGNVIHVVEALFLAAICGSIIWWLY